MQLVTVRTFFSYLLVLLCLGLAPHASSASVGVDPGIPSLVKERTEATFALPLQRNAVQALNSTRDPLPPSTGGSIGAVLPILPSLADSGQGRLSVHKVRATVVSTEPDSQRARSPPLS